MSRDFSFKNIDQEGKETLDTIAQANQFNDWMFETIKPFCSGRILEIGSGIGNISSRFIDHNYDIVLSDVREQYCDQLSIKFPNSSVQLVDLVKSDFKKNYKDLIGQFDTIVALNVVEHIEDDRYALANIKQLLKPGGKCVILVPAFDALYNAFDKELFHFRRYNRKTLKALMSDHLKISYSRYFNPIGVFGWYLNGSILKKKNIPSDQMKMFDHYVPLFKMVDFFTKQLFGLSVMAVAHKER